MIIRKSILVLLCSIIFPVVAYSDPYSEDHVKHMCDRLDGQFETALTLSNLGVQNLPINVFKVMGQDLSKLMLDGYDFLNQFVNSPAELDQELEKTDNALIVAYDEFSTNSRVLIGHTLENSEVKRSLENIKIIYANLSYSDIGDLQEGRKELMHRLEIFPPAVIFSSKSKNGVQVNKVGFVNKCVKPSDLITWVEKNASNKTN